MQTLNRLLSAAGVAAALFVSPASAQPATGAVRGTVANAATRAHLLGAAVRVVGTDRVAFTEGDGSFLLTGVPA